MYGDIPLILQGAATRETLSPDQLYRLGATGTTTAKANVNVSSVLPMLLIGGVAAWFLAGGSKHRSLWALFLLLPSLVMAQTPFVKEVVSGTDTLTVYGTYTTTVTVDSVVKKFTPPPIILGKPYAPSGLMALATQPYTPFTADGGAASGKSSYVVDNLTKAKQRNINVVLGGIPCGSHNTSNLGNCLVLKNGVAVFSQARWDSAMATYNTAAIKAAIATAYAEGTLLAINIMDEPWVSGGGDGNTWGPPGTMTRARVDTLCTKARAVLGNVPIGTSDQIAWAKTGPWKSCDFGLAQFSYRMGSPAAWRDSLLALSSAQGYQSAFSFNIINGGTQDRDGAWDCAAQGGVKGQRSPNCQMTPAQVVTAGTALGDAGCGFLMMWRYDKTRYSLAGFASAFQQVANIQAQRAQNKCVVR